MTSATASPPADGNRTCDMSRWSLSWDVFADTKGVRRPKGPNSFHAKLFGLQELRVGSTPADYRIRRGRTRSTYGNTAQMGCGHLRHSPNHGPVQD